MYMCVCVCVYVCVRVCVCGSTLPLLTPPETLLSLCPGLGARTHSGRVNMDTTADKGPETVPLTDHGTKSLSQTEQVLTL